MRATIEDITMASAKRTRRDRGPATLANGKPNGTTAPQELPTSTEPGKSGKRARILVVEDEQDLQDLLRYNLERDGFEVVSALNGERALSLVRADPPDLVLLDLMLPGMDGLSVCRALKAESGTARVPIVMVTAKGEEADVVIGLELGADDYLAKPFSPRVLIARVRAVLRRQEQVAAATGGADDGSIRVGDVSVSLDRHEVRVRGQPVELTATEFRLLSLLAAKPGRVFTRQQIIQAVHGNMAAVTDRSVDVQVVGLRRKLGDEGQLIQTVRGVGYRFKE